MGSFWLRAWIDWARLIVDDSAHAAVCDGIRDRVRPGAASPSADGADAPDLRWPGYVGAAYRPGGVLCVSNIHTRFQSGGLASAEGLVTSALDAHRHWTRHEMDDAEWLASVRAMYAAGLGPGGWSVAGGYREAWRQLGEDAHSIAYVNAARCQWFGMKPPKALYAECLTAMPLDPLLDILSPRLVLTTSPSVHARWAARDELPVVYFHQMYGTLVRSVTIRDVTGTARCLAERVRAAEWAEALADAGYAR
jgi:hypothetical protein